MSSPLRVVGCRLPKVIRSELALSIEDASRASVQARRPGGLDRHRSGGLIRVSPHHLTQPETSGLERIAIPVTSDAASSAETKDYKTSRPDGRDDSHWK
jgi:hypothetical protein